MEQLADGRGWRPPAAGVSRRLLLGASAASALLSGLPVIAQTPASEADLLTAIRGHLQYSAGFRRKFRTGFYRIGDAVPTPKECADVLARIKERLAALDGESRALVHHLGSDGLLRAWLIESSGVIASSTGTERYEGLAFLTSALDVDSRMVTRAAVPRRQAVTPPNPALPVPAMPAMTRFQALRLARDQLLGPEIVERLSATAGRILILPARDTGAGPYPAMSLLDGSLLLTRHAVVVVPDIETLADPTLVHRVSEIDWTTALLAGNPDLSGDRDFNFRPLPGAQAEVELIQQIVGAAERRTLLGVRADLGSVVAMAKGYGSADLLFLASHAIANAVNPMDGSFVALTNGHLTGQLLRSDIFEAWSARHPTVVLSACQTALGKSFDGGFYGIARAMFSAGAAQVVSSLWSVDDEATRLLMGEFMDRLYLGFSTEEALRRAQIKASALYQGDPGAWASFAVFGMPSASALR
jgi:hypothetical protein